MKRNFLSAAVLLITGCASSTHTAFYQQAAERLFPIEGPTPNGETFRNSNTGSTDYSELLSQVDLCVAKLESEHRGDHLLSHFTPTDAAIDLLECLPESGWTGSR
jgi:hypothetical protein